MLAWHYSERIQVKGNRFAVHGNSGDLYRRRYWNDALFEAVGVAPVPATAWQVPHPCCT
jgi:hypothetical protein